MTPVAPPSQTIDRDVALGYAAGGGNNDKAGFIFEIQQGMVDRGAELSFLSQYPHEQGACSTLRNPLAPCLA